MKSLFEGVGTALITPFNTEGAIDFPSFGRLVDRQLEAGINALIVGATTGEGACLRAEEKEELIVAAAERVRGFYGSDEKERPAVIAGISCNVTSAAEEYCRRLGNLPADGLLVTTPFYNKTSQKGLIRFYERLADASPKPIIIYNVPQRTGMTVSPSVYEVLSAHPNICGIKEADSDMNRFPDAVKAAENLTIYSGCDELALPMFCLGAGGWISVVSNLFPEKCVELYEAFLSGFNRKAAAINSEILPFVRLAFSEVNPVPVKAMAAFLNLCEEWVREPLCALGKEEREKLSEEFGRLGGFGVERAFTAKPDKCENRGRGVRTGGEREYSCSRR